VKENDEPNAKGIFGNDGIAREQHLHGMLASDIARDGDHRCRAEQADVHAGCENLAVVEAIARSQVATS
jgi:hypothetical protein